MALGSVAAGPAQYSAPPTATAPAVGQSAASARRAAVVTALLGTAVDVKPIYGTLIAGGILALGVAVVMLGLRPGGAR